MPHYNETVCHTVSMSWQQHTIPMPQWNSLPHCHINSATSSATLKQSATLQNSNTILFPHKKKCIPHVVVLKQGVIHNHLTPFQSWIISMDFSYYYHIGIPITRHCCRALNTQHAGNTENWLHFINNHPHNHHPLHQTPLTLCSASPMRQTARKVGTQRLNSAIQLASVDLGQMTRWGDGMLR